MHGQSSNLLQHLADLEGGYWDWRIRFQYRIRIGAPQELRRGTRNCLAVDCAPEAPQTKPDARELYFKVFKWARGSPESIK